MTGIWDYSKLDKPYFYGQPTTYKEGATFLDGHGKIEDWGCGGGAFKTFIKESEYVGIDSAHSIYVDIVADLEEYKSKVPCIFMRHVLEHNYGWRKILQNALDSFTDRMILIIYTEFQSVKEMVNSVDSRGRPTISFVKSDIIDMFKDIKFNENIFTNEEPYSKESVFYLEKHEFGRNKEDNTLSTKILIS